MSKDPIVNSAHPVGLTCLTFSRDGSRAYTGGSDCIVRVWHTDQGADQEPEMATEADQGITSLSAAYDCWLSGSEDSVVRRYDKHKPDLLGHVASANAVPIHSVSVNPEGNRVAVASDELSVKVIDLKDIQKLIVLKGHKRAVRRTTWHPSGTLLTTCGSDGKLIIWDISEEEGKEEKVIEGILPSILNTQSPEFSHDCSAVWHPSGQYFFIATRAHEIITVSRSTWAKASTFSDDNVTGPTTSLALSPNGFYLASASRSTIYIWSTQTRQLLYQHSGEPNSVITQLAFSPTKNLLAWTDNTGLFTRWQNPIPSSSPDPVKQPSAVLNAANASTRPASAALFGDSTNDDDVDVGGEIGQDGEDWIIDDLGIMEEGEEPRAGLVKEMVSITKAQPPFQPGSTPMENKKRYLAFNTVGVIEVTDQDTHQIVNVEFHDQSTRKGYHFTDHFKYDLGYLGERGALFACQAEQQHPAQVYYKPYASWTSQGEWTYSVPSPSSSVPTKILAVAAGGMPPSDSLRRNAEDDLQGFGDVVVATSDGDLTFLSGTGRERRILGVGAEVVSMVASVEWVFVVHRNGSTTIDGSQSLSYSLINFEDFTVRQRDILPIPKGHVLKWVGLTTEGAPAIYDSTGRLHVLTKFRIPHHASWAPVLDTQLLERREGKDESYWPVGVSGSAFMCLILKGRQEHPAFPRPLIQELPLRLPFRVSDNKESSLEEHIARETLLLELARDSLGEQLTTDDISKREIAMDKELIQLIQAACKADNIPRAIELTKLLHHTASFGMASKVAAFYHLVGLQEKIAFLKEKREQEEEEEDRLEAARRKRRQWTVPDPLPRSLPNLAPSAGGGGPSSRPNLLQDFGPPPAVYRPGLARAVPVVETTRFSANSGDAVEGFSYSADADLLSADATPEGKRKRADEDGMSVDVDEHAKRRAFEVSTPQPKTKQNPFAKKSGQDNGRNPFARKAEPNRVIQKSESFFDKVDAAEVDKTKAKGKEKSKKQTTLFGLPAGQAPEKKTRNKKDGDKPSPPALDAATQPESVIPESTPSSTLVETQPVEDDSQTQTVIDSQDASEPAGSPEPIEWPPSPQAADEIPADA